MATGKVVGQIQVTQGNIKVIGVDGAVREPGYEGYIYENEQVISNDPNALFQIKFLALPESSAYDGIFRILADGSVIHGRDAMDSMMSDENLVSILETSAGEEGVEDLETAAGEEGAEGSSSFTETDIVAESSVLGFNRGANGALGFGITDFGSNVNYDAAQITPPAITSPNVVIYDENDTIPVIQITATAEGAVTYGIGGLDSGFFDIDSATGLVTFKESPDFENPRDSGGDNEYNTYVTVTDSFGNYTTQLLSVSINNLNEAVTAFDDAVDAVEDSVLYSTIDLDANDTDLDGDNLTVHAGTYTTNQGGTIVIAADGSYTYTPPTNFNGVDSVNYTVTDGEFTDVGMLTINVAPVDDTPPIVIPPIVIPPMNGSPAIELEAEDDTVFESGLSTGTDADEDTEFASGTFTLSDPNGLDDIESVTINGTTIAIADLGNNNVVTSAIGTLTVTDYNDSTGVATYKYTLTSPTTDKPDVTEQDIFALTANDGTVDSEVATITIDIVDDVPIISSTDAILTNQVGNILSSADLGINIGADSPIASIVLTPEVNANGFAVNASGNLLTSSVGETTYNLVYVPDDNGGVVAYQWRGTADPLPEDLYIENTILGSPVFTLTPNISAGTYSVEILGQLDGSVSIISFAYEDANATSTGGNVAIYTFVIDNGTSSTADDLVVVASATDSLDNPLSVNFNAANGLGVGTASKINPGDVLTLEFDKPLNVGTTFTLAHYSSGDLADVVLYSNSAELTSAAFTIVGDVLTITDLGGAASFNEIDFLHIGTDGNGYSLQAMTAVINMEDLGFPHTINVDIATTDADGDVVNDALQVTFDNDGNIVGTESDEMIVDEDGDGYIDGGAGSDIIYGGAGDDTIVYDIADVEIDGESGVDTLIANSEIVDLSNVSNIEVIQLNSGATVTGTGDADSINADDVMSATDGGILIIQSDDGDASTQAYADSTFGDATMIIADDGNSYAQYTDGTATLLIQIEDIVVPT